MTLNIFVQLLGNPLPPNWPGGYWWHLLVFALFIAALTMVMILVFIYAERRGVARMQIRFGPNRCGPFGVLQGIADAFKVLSKEDIVPDKADKWLHFLGPILLFPPILMVLAVVPLGNNGALVNLNIGILYVAAISSISTIGVIMASWGSNNKYSLIAAMRTIAQMVSYEMPILLSIVGVVLLAGSLSLNKIVDQQSIPFILFQPLGFLIFLIGLMAEMNRAPFDLLEAESEIVAGVHTEYSNMKFAMFYLGEYGHAFAGSAILTTLFLGGWKGPVLPPLVWILLKSLIVFGVVFWARATLPRFRVDQLMAFVWKCLLPMAFINLFITAVEVVIWRSSLSPVIILVNFAVAGLLVLAWSRLFSVGGGRVAVR